MKKKILLISSLAIFIFLATLTMVFLIFSKPSSPIDTNEANTTESSESTDSEKKLSPFEEIMGRSSSTCNEISPNPKLTVLPMKKEDIGIFIPLGSVVGAHVTPIDHAYFSPKDFVSKDRYQYKVYAVADATLTNISRRNIPVTDTPDGKITDDYRLVFQISCTYGYYYDLVTKLDDSIQSQMETIPEGGSAQVDIKVKAGDPIGFVGTQTLDFGTYDASVTLQGFLNPESYKGEAWKIHTTDPVEAFSDELKTEIMKLNPRKVAPYGGKIDYDQKGKLVGNYFKAGTNGYSGASRERYWDGHLSFTYDHYDPSFLVMSIGNYNNIASQFSIKDNLPNFSEIDINNGLVKYELTNREYIRKSGLPYIPSNYYDDITLQKNLEVVGTALVQVIDDNSIKFEVFPGKKKTQVSTFTSNAAIYVR